MVKKGDYLFVENLLSDLHSNEEEGNGRLFYDYLKQEKINQRSVNGAEVLDLPCDCSEYNIMFMTF
ncbi:hypothetical protein [Clostridium thermarum]|uniref:hypothetical protein n=1 Tax=Clostridium thermarum TaxID=1716543 RepID=UPI00111FE548|nr:hypothetical protein [Clostridium thermarum]